MYSLTCFLFAAEALHPIFITIYFIAGNSSTGKVFIQHGSAMPLATIFLILFFPVPLNFFYSFLAACDILAYALVNNSSFLFIALDLCMSQICCALTGCFSFLHNDDPDAIISGPYRPFNFFWGLTLPFNFIWGALQKGHFSLLRKSGSRC